MGPCPGWRRSIAPCWVPTVGRRLWGACVGRICSVLLGARGRDALRILSSWGRSLTVTCLLPRDHQASELCPPAGLGGRLVLPGERSWAVVTNQALPCPTIPASVWTMLLPRGITHFRAVLGGNSGPATGAPFPPSELTCQAGLGAKPPLQMHLRAGLRQGQRPSQVGCPALPSCLPAVSRGGWSCRGRTWRAGCRRRAGPPPPGEGHSGSCSLTAPWRPSPLLEDRPPCAGCFDDEGVTEARAAPPAERALVLRPYLLLQTPARKGINGWTCRLATPLRTEGLALSSQGCTKMPLTSGFSVSTEPEV